MKASFEKTVDILVKAYLNDTLQHADCTRCAVGNLVSHATGNRCPTAWYNVVVWRYESYPVAEQQIEATGYTKEDLAEIEAAFESVFEYKFNDEEMFNGLMRVVDVLADIHGIDLEQKESAKALFVKP